MVSSAEVKEAVVYGDVDLDYLEQVKTSFPISKRKEVYKLATPV